MPIDTDIYGRLKQIDMGGSFSRGLDTGAKMGKMIEDRQIDNAYKSGITQNADGSTSFDKRKTLASLASVNGREYMDASEKFNAQDAAKSKANMDQQLQKMNIASQLAGSARDQNSWTNARQTAIKMGLATEQELPQGYDPNFVRTMQMRVLSAQDQLKAQFDQEKQAKEFQYKDREMNNKDREFNSSEKWKAKDYNIKAQELELNKLKSNGAGGGRTEGQKALDKDFAKDYNDWTSGGAGNARSEITKLQGVVETLKKGGTVTTGGLTGMFPDRMTSDSLLRARSDVQSTVMNSLKSIMGSAFTEKEGERVIKNTWNEADSTENNLARLERLVADLTNQAIEKDQKAQHFSRTGSLVGLGFSGEQQDQTPKVIRMTDGKGGIFDIPADQKGEAIAAGLKVGG